MSLLCRLHTHTPADTRANTTGAHPPDYPQLRQSHTHRNPHVGARVCRWRGKTLLQPFWSNGSLVVRAVPSGELVYRGRPGAMKDGLVSNGDVEQLCGLFPGRLGVSQARRLLRSVGGDVDVALAVLMDEDATDLR